MTRSPVSLLLVMAVSGISTGFCVGCSVLVSRATSQTVVCLFSGYSVTLRPSLSRMYLIFLPFGGVLARYTLPPWPSVNTTPPDRVVAVPSRPRRTNFQVVRWARSPKKRHCSPAFWA